MADSLSAKYVNGVVPLYTAQNRPELGTIEITPLVVSQISYSELVSGLSFTPRLFCLWACSPGFCDPIGYEGVYFAFEPTG